MYFAAQRVAAGWRHFGRRDSIAQRPVRPEVRVRHAEGLEDALLHEIVESLTTGRFHDETEDIGAKIGVDVAAARSALQLRLEHRVARFVRRECNAPEVSPSRQSGPMLEEL